MRVLVSEISPWVGTRHLLHHSPSFVVQGFWVSSWDTHCYEESEHLTVHRASVMGSRESRDAGIGTFTVSRSRGQSPSLRTAISPQSSMSTTKPTPMLRKGRVAWRRKRGTERARRVFGLKDRPVARMTLSYTSPPGCQGFGFGFGF